MGILSTEQLIHGVKNGRPIAPFSIQDEIIEQYIKLIKLKRMTLKTDSQEAKLLSMHLREPLDFVRQEKDWPYRNVKYTFFHCLYAWLMQKHLEKILSS